MIKVNLKKNPEGTKIDDEILGICNFRYNVVERRMEQEQNNFHHINPFIFMTSNIMQNSDGKKIRYWNFIQMYGPWLIFSTVYCRDSKKRNPVSYGNSVKSIIIIIIIIKCERTGFGTVAISSSFNTANGESMKYVTANFLLTRQCRLSRVAPRTSTHPFNPSFLNRFLHGYPIDAKNFRDTVIYSTFEFRKINFKSLNKMPGAGEGGIFKGWFDRRIDEASQTE